MPRELLQLSTDVRPETIRSVREIVSQVARQAGADGESVESIKVCVSEALTNVVRHAYADGGGRVGVAATKTDGEIEIVVRDAGRGFVEGSVERGIGLGAIVEKLAARHALAPALGGGLELTMTFPLHAATAVSSSRDEAAVEQRPTSLAPGLLHVPRGP